MPSPKRFLTPRTAAVVLAVLGLVASACGDSDDGASVREIGGSSAESGSASGSASSSAPADSSGSASAPGGDEAGASGDGGYEYASDVDAHRRVVLDVCEIGALLDDGDLEAAEELYRQGSNSVNSDGSVRSIGDFATSEDRRHGLDSYYGEPMPLDSFISSAFSGSGVFEGQVQAVRVQGIEKGIQNQVMVAWTVHELNSALAKAAEGNFDVAEGAVHNWDEGWAFYHGAEPGCAPYATADTRSADFGTSADGGTSPANEQILAAMVAGRDGLLGEDAGAAEDAARTVMANLVVTYSQAAIRYASLIEGDMAAGDDETAKVHQAEGLAFWRVIEAYVAPEGADAEAVNAIYDLANEPGANGFGDEVRAALRPAWDAFGISEDDIGELDG